MLARANCHKSEIIQYLDKIICRNDKEGMSNTIHYAAFGQNSVYMLPALAKAGLSRQW